MTRPSRTLRAPSRRRASALLAAALCSLAALAPASASAFVEPGFTGNWSDYANCPVTFPAVDLGCIHSYTKAGVVKIGHSSTQISIPGNTLDWGFTDENVSGKGIVVSPPHGILNGPAQPVPGGLLGSVGGVRVSGVKARLEWVTAAPNTVIGAVERCTGTDPFVTFSSCRVITAQDGTAVTLSVKIHLISPFLGPNCYIGSAADPIVIALTTGITSPPPPAQPIHGRSFEFLTSAGLDREVGINFTFVNNSFSVPGAHGCGTSTGNLVDQAINNKIGLPSAAGQNAIVLNVDGEQAPAAGVLAHGWTGENGSPEAAEETAEETASAAGPSSLPSGRANELVSPLAKNGLTPYAAVPSKDGEAVDFQARGALPGAGSGALNLYRATRGSGGWQTTALTPTPPTPLKSLEIQAPVWVSGDLSQTIFTTPSSYAAADQDTGANSLYRSDGSGLEWLSQGSQGGNEAKHATFDGATPDGRHVVFSSAAALLPGATELEPEAAPEAEHLYERDVASGETHLLSLDPGGQIAGSATSTLATDYPVGNGRISVTRAEGFSPGQRITVGTGASAETALIQGIEEVTETTEEINVNDGHGLSHAHPAGTPVTQLSEGSILGDGSNLNSGPVPSTEYLPANASSGSTTNAISEDGSKVFFESPNPSSGQPIGLFMRQDNSTTVKIAGARLYGTRLVGVFGHIQTALGSARYQGAAANGSLAFFTSDEGLAGATQGKELYEFNTTDHEIGGVPPLSVSPLSAGLGGDRAPATTLTSTAFGYAETLYVASTAGFAAGETIAFARFPVSGGRYNSTLTRVIASVKSPTELTLTIGLNGVGFGGAPSGTEIHAVHPASVTAISNDGSHVYFTSDGVLAENTNAEGATATPAKPNLYLFDTTNGETTFIATLAKSDVENAEGVRQNLADQPDISRPAVPTPDGSVLAFASAANLTGQNPWQKYTEIYRYSVNGGELECLSCTAPGVRPTGNANFGETAGGSYDPPGLTSPITEDASMVFFDSPDSLVAEDQNGAAPPSAKFGDPTSTDVYQWSPEGLSMLSSGTSTTPAILQGTTPDGSDVLFATTGQAVPGQNDGGYENIIDARLGGGFPAGEEAGTPSCVGESCREALGEAPVFGPPATRSAPGETPVLTQPKKKHPKKNKKKHRAKKRADRNRGTGR